MVSSNIAILGTIVTCQNPVVWVEVARVEVTYTILAPR